MSLDNPAVSLDISLLRTFLTVVDSSSFASAAEVLAITPSAVSGHIKRLEDDVGIRLLTRTTRRLALTPEGELLYTYARNITSLEREFRAKLRGSHVEGRIRVGSSEDFAGTWLAEVLQTFGRSFPRTAIEMKVGITSDLLQQQQQGKLDVVFGKQCSRVTDEGDLLWEEPLVWAFNSKAVLADDGPLTTGPYSRSPVCTVKPPSVHCRVQGDPGGWRSRAAAWPVAFPLPWRALPLRPWPAANCVKGL